MRWTDRLTIDPTERLLASEGVLPIFVEKHILGKSVDTVKAALGSREVIGILRTQRPDVSWGPGKGSRPDPHAALVRSFKDFRRLVHRYELGSQVPEVSKAAEFLFSHQTEEGDFRGMIGDQYATYYTGEFLSLLIQAGYGSDERVEAGMQWLLRMRQDDGGWTVPLLTRGLSWNEISRLTSVRTEPLPPDRSKPFSHNWTDMVLRAFSVHPAHRKDREALHAADLLKGSLFLPDNYSSYRDPRYWTRFVGWWPNLLTALEVLDRMGFQRNDSGIAKGIAWFISNQAADGLWDLEAGRPGKTAEREWLTFRICRMLKGYGLR